MKRLTTLALLALVGLLSIGAQAAVAGQRLNAYSLESQFICVSCHEPLNQVNSPESQEEKQALAHLVKAGLTLSQIKAQMVDDFTVAVLAKPPAKGINLLVYILPPLVLIGGLGFLAYSLPRWRRRTRTQQAAGAGPTGPPLNQADAERLDHELADFDS